MIDSLPILPTVLLAAGVWIAYIVLEFRASKREHDASRCVVSGCGDWFWSPFAPWASIVWGCAMSDIDLLGALADSLRRAQQRRLDDQPCPKCGGDRLRTDFAKSGSCHSPLSTGGAS